MSRQCPHFSVFMLVSTCPDNVLSSQSSCWSQHVQTMSSVLGLHAGLNMSRQCPVLSSCWSEHIQTMSSVLSPHGGLKMSRQCPQFSVLILFSACPDNVLSPCGGLNMSSVLSSIFMVVSTCPVSSVPSSCWSQHVQCPQFHLHGGLNLSGQCPPCSVFMVVSV